MSTNRLNKTLTSLVLAGSLVGCGDPNMYKNSQPAQEPVKVQRNYLAQIRPSSHGSPSVVTQDFDGDGFNDLVVVQKDDLYNDTPQRANYKTRLYFFKGDGKGNFALKTYEENK